MSISPRPGPDLPLLFYKKFFQKLLTKSPDTDIIRKMSDAAQIFGGIAQLGERLNGIQEVSGSIPLISTRTTEIKGKALDFGVFLFCSFMKFFGRCDGVVTSVI